MLPKKYPYGNKGSFKYSIGYIHIQNLFPIPLCIKWIDMLNILIAVISM